MAGQGITAEPDRLRGRTAALYQLLFGGVVLVVALFVSLSPFPGDLQIFLGGVVLVFIATGATLVVPWNRIPLGWMAIIPAVDIIAISLMRASSTTSGFGLLWVFPALWLPVSFGLAGLLGGVIAITGAFFVTVAAHPSETFTYSAVVLPLVIIAVSGASYLTARRSAAQSSLLAKQAELLGHALERTRRQEQAVTEVLDAVDFGVIRIASDGSVSITNDAHARLQHLGPRDHSAASPAYGADGVTPVPDSELPLERALRGEAFDGQITWFGESRADERALSVTVRRLTDEKGGDVGAVLVSRDVTLELQARRARDELVASVSHELRTPLTSILGYLDLALDDESLPASTRRGLEIAERNAERLLQIVADILRASSESQGSIEMTITPEDIDVDALLRTAVESMQPRAAEAGVSIDESGIEPTPAYADPARLRQVLDNLLANAISFNKEGGTVTVGCTTDGDSSWILVRDTGVGMTQEEIAGLFERFYRARSVRTAGRHGTGLGLAISRDIARAHGGEITVRSTPGEGSTFIVRIPSTRASASPAPRLSPPNSRPTREGEDV